MDRCVLEVGLQHDQIAVHVHEHRPTEQARLVVDEAAVGDGDCPALYADGASLAFTVPTTLTCHK